MTFPQISNILDNPYYLYPILGLSFIGMIAFANYSINHYFFRSKIEEYTTQSGNIISIYPDDTKGSLLTVQKKGLDSELLKCYSLDLNSMIYVNTFFRIEVDNKKLYPENSEFEKKLGVCQSSLNELKKEVGEEKIFKML